MRGESIFLGVVAGIVSLVAMGLFSYLAFRLGKLSLADPAKDEGNRSTARTVAIGAAISWAVLGVLFFIFGIFIHPTCPSGGESEAKSVKSSLSKAARFAEFL